MKYELPFDAARRSNTVPIQAGVRSLLAGKISSGLPALLRQLGNFTARLDQQLSYNLQRGLVEICFAQQALISLNIERENCQIDHGGIP
jgi:hypothetical protein